MAEKLNSVLNIEIDTGPLEAKLAEFKREFAANIRTLPRVTEVDGSQWVDVTDLMAWADRLVAP